MSPTPRTDAAVIKSGGKIIVEFRDSEGNPGMQCTEVVPSDFARGLERENATLREIAQIAVEYIEDPDKRKYYRNRIKKAGSKP